VETLQTGVQLATAELQARKAVLAEPVQLAELVVLLHLVLSQLHEHRVVEFLVKE
jgi:hypothetical protein